MRRALLFACAAILGGCRAENAPQAPASTTLAYAMERGIDTLLVNVRASRVEWKGTKFFGLGKHEGIVRLASGRVIVENGVLAGGTFVLDMTSIEVTDIPKSDPVPRKRLRDHLMSADFFAVDAYPTARFVVTDVARSERGTVAVAGTLTMRGRTQPVTFPAVLSMPSRDVLRATATFSIDRQRWGVAYRGSRLTNDLVDDDIHLTLVLVATRSAKL